MHAYRYTKVYIVTLLNQQVGKMKRILCSDGLPEKARQEGPTLPAWEFLRRSYIKPNKNNINPFIVQA